jgi:carbonic anhydrase
VNKPQPRDNLWTGTAYQVGLNYIKDFMTTHLINVLEKREEKITNFTTRGLQFHFHNPSEHTIDGKSFDLELHVVHKLMYAQKN